MKYKILILSLFVSLVGYCQQNYQVYPVVRNDSIFLKFKWTIPATDSVYMWLDPNTPFPIAITGYAMDTAKLNLRNEMLSKQDTVNKVATKFKLDSATAATAAALAASTQARLNDSADAIRGTVNGKQPSGNYLLNTSTSNIGTSPTASSTVTITHNLGRVPTIIRIYGYGTFTSNAAATATTSSMGVWNSSGNRCVYQRYGAAITTTQVGLSSNTFCILLATGGGNFISGVIQNVTSTQFDIVWTETGTATAQVYLWECQ